MDFQLQEHERFLHKFTDLFKQIDQDSDGILSESEFRTLIQMMNVVEMHEIDTLLAKVDPNNNQKMTYSEIVHLLSCHLTRRHETDPEQIPVLEKFINSGIEEEMAHLQHNLPGQQDGLGSDYHPVMP